MAIPKRAARPAGMLVIGMAMIAIGIARDMVPFIAAGGLFVIIGAVNMRKTG